MTALVESPLRSVLGIDAAWSSTHPSGVALVSETSAGWKMVAVEASYQRFIALSDTSMTPDVRMSGSVPQAADLLAACNVLARRSVDLVAIDMPLSFVPITGRRASDDAVSRAYGARKCGTHTPSALRPGKVSDELTLGFAQCGYPLLVNRIEPPGLIEVYPHPALVELAYAAERLPYKASKVRKYWPLLTPAERRINLCGQWEKIVCLLEHEIAGVADALGKPDSESSGTALKAYEDMLDAIACAWIAICALNGQATPFGDSKSAIWVPAKAGK